MNDVDLKKKLAVLKTLRVPKGYWERQASQVLLRIEDAPRRNAAVRVHETAPVFSMRIWAPAFAALMVGALGFWTGRSHPPKSSLPMVFVSGSSDISARKVFGEMLELFPNRVNWLSFMDGKADFSIRSEAYPDSKPLVPLVIYLPRAKEAFEARLLIRPGQSVSVLGQWAKFTPALIQVSLSSSGDRARIRCRLNESNGLDTEVIVNQEGTQPLGSFRFGERLVQVQLTRPKAREAAEKSRAL